MAVKVAIVSQKGGCGKSTMAQMVAREFAAAGWEVKIADLDTRQGTSTYWKQLRERGEVEPIVAVEPVGSVRQAMKSDSMYDLLIFDGPPQASTIVAEAAQVSDVVLLPTSVGEADLRPAVLLAHELVREGVLSTRILFVLNRAGTDVENALARVYIQEAGYEVASGELLERPGYRLAYQKGLSPTETPIKSLRRKASEVATAVVKKIEQLRRN